MSNIALIKLVCAEKFQLTREAQDEYALESLSNALAAQQAVEVVHRGDVVEALAVKLEGGRVDGDAVVAADARLPGFDLLAQLAVVLQEGVRRVRELAAAHVGDLCVQRRR